jgi:hypothetical protein
MPTVLRERGWRLFFYANESQEPIHIHGSKGDAECKFWINVDERSIVEEFAFNLTPRLRREVRRLILANFDLIVQEWDRVQGEHRDGDR